VKYVAHGSAGPARMYLAMEWLEGKPLDDVLARGPIELADAFAIGARVARALAAAHAEGIVHRDVKPANVVLRGDRADDAVLVDFGIARVANASRVMTATGVIIGTPQYMAPEQVRGGREIDLRVDVFALGCVLFECLAGRPPFAGDEIVAVLAKILLEPAPRVSSFRRDVPRALDDLVASMLQKDTEARPAALGRVASALEGFASAESVALEAAPAPQVIGSLERGLATVLLARPNAKARERDDDALADTEALLAGVTGDAVVEVVARLGLTVHQLADGALVAVLSAAEGGAEAASRMVEGARTIAREMPGARVAVSTGRAVVAGVLPVGEAIDGAARLLGESTEPGVMVCPVTSALPLRVRRSARARAAVEGRERSELAHGDELHAHDRDVARRSERRRRAVPAHRRDAPVTGESAPRRIRLCQRGVLRPRHGPTGRCRLLGAALPRHAERLAGSARVRARGAREGRAAPWRRR
jgi:hypothetical protein